MPPLAPLQPAEPPPSTSLSSSPTTTFAPSRSPSRRRKSPETALPGAYPSEKEDAGCTTCFRRRRRVFERPDEEGEGSGGIEREGRLRAVEEGEGRSLNGAWGGTSGLKGLFKRRKRERVAAESDLATATTTFGPAFDCSRWMSLLPDDAKLDELYIPGTHESLALHFPLLGSICQTTSITSQLRGGIRFLDFRFSLLPLGQSTSRQHPRQFSTGREGGEGEGEWELRAYHGILTQLKGAEEVFEEVYRWLESEEGRGETVVVSCKQARRGFFHSENATPSDLFATTLWALLDRRKEMWYTEERWPSLGEVRGKCVMFCRFYFDGRGLHPPIWPNDNLAAWSTEIGKREVVVQDWYGLPSLFSIPQKAALALSLFDPPPSTSTSTFSSSSSAPPAPVASTLPSFPLRINFLSSARLPFLPPSLAAKGFGLPRWHLGVWGVNELFLRGLRKRKRDGWLRGRKEGEGGMIVMMDFWESTGQGQGEGGLVQEVIDLNFT